MKIAKNSIFLYILLIFTTIKANNKNSLDDFFQEKLKDYKLYSPNLPVKYCYKTEILNDTKDSFELDPEIDLFAKKLNSYLNQSIFFEPEFLLNSEKVRNYHLKNKPYKQNTAKIIETITEDGNKVQFSYFNRNSDTLIIIGAGFTNDREVMSPFIDIFSDYDLILFDYRGHGFKKNGSLSKSIFNVNCQKTELGLGEEKDVFAVINYAKNQKNYAQVIGLGVCFSALIFMKTSATYKNSFDKLILDSTWLSLENFIEKLIEDPKRICSPQNGGLKNNCLVKKYWFQQNLKNFTQSLFNVKFNKISILDYIDKIDNIPLLFFYGKNDLVVSRKEFETIYNNAKTDQKTAIITSNPHVRNHLKEKEQYKLICDLFVTLPNKKFIDCLKNKEKLVEYQINKIKNL